MGASFGDFDNDLGLDLYVSNMLSKAGLRIIDQVGMDNERFRWSAEVIFFLPTREERASSFCRLQPVHSHWLHGLTCRGADNLETLTTMATSISTFLMAISQRPSSLPVRLTSEVAIGTRSYARINNSIHVLLVPRNGALSRGPEARSKISSRIPMGPRMFGLHFPTAAKREIACS